MKNKLSNKWSFAIGHTSRVPRSGGVLHYLIADLDTGEEDPWPQLECLPWDKISSAILQRTQHGWHLYTDYRGTMIEITDLLRYIGADHNWIEIGIRRGYWFLADKDEVHFNWPVECMVIYDGKKGKKGDSTTS